MKNGRILSLLDSVSPHLAVTRTSDIKKRGGRVIAELSYGMRELSVERDRCDRAHLPSRKPGVTPGIALLTIEVTVLSE